MLQGKHLTAQRNIKTNDYEKRFQEICYWTPWYERNGY